MFNVTAGYVELNPLFRNYEERSIKIEEILKKLRDDNKFVGLKGWRNECYEVGHQYNATKFFKMDRSATCLFGILNYGVDITGYVRHPTLGICLWFQQRAFNKQTWPGKWDNLVGGGLSVGHGILETAYKESKEEASIPEPLLKKLVSAGSVSFFYESERGIFPNTVFVFEIELPLDFIPVNGDGEVEKFELLPADKCLDRICDPDFKMTSAPVVLDFMIRHGIVNAENEKDLLRITEYLHIPLQTFYKKIVPKKGIGVRQENGNAKNESY